MKNYYFFLFFSLVVLSCSQSDSPNKNFVLNDSETISKRENSCFDNANYDPTECVEIFNSSHNITLAQYPGCTFEVSFHYVRCFDMFTGERRLYMDDFELISHDCPQFNADVSAARQNGTLSEFTIEFEQEIWKEITLFALNNIGSTPGWVASVNYFYSSCTNFCYYEGTKGNFNYYYYLKTLCGDGCCTIWSRWVVDSNGWYLDTSIDTSDDPLICDETQYVHSCGLGSIFNTECTYTCDIFEFE